MHLTSTAARLVALAAALLALALVGAGCGGDDGGSGGDPEAEITTVIEEAVNFEDPATTCEENFTEKALEENYEGEDREALLEDCSDDETGTVTDVEVSNVTVDGDTATAEVSARDDDEGETIEFEVELADEDGWKIDAVK
jgi:hypothetical protein